MEKLVKELPINDRPREKAFKYGIGALSNAELLAIIIRNGYQGHSSIEIGKDIVKKAKGIANIQRLTMYDLLSIKGIKKVKALELLSCFEICKRMSYEQCLDKDIVSQSSDVINYLKLAIGSSSQEQFVVIYLNTNNEIIEHKILFKGTINSSLVDIREILKIALQLNAVNIIVAHNHPTGNLTPSKADLDLTNRLVKSSDLMNIKLIDHFIISNNNYYSFHEQGIID